MAQFETIDAIEKLTGKMSRTDRTVMRQKKYKINGKIVGMGPKEAFNKEKRDFRRKPKKGAEAAQNERWTAVCHEAKTIIGNEHHARYKELHDRWEAQISGKPDAALGKKRILQFPNFVRSVLSHE